MYIPNDKLNPIYNIQAIYNEQIITIELTLKKDNIYICNVKDIGKFNFFVEKLYKEATGPLKQEIRSSLLTLLALEIVTLFAENQETGSPRLSRQDQVFRNFTISLAKNVSRHRTVEFYANEACLTPKYFSTVIKKRSGKLPMDWITERTIVLIKFLLQNSDKSIQEISNDLNFPNQSFFTRYFKNHTGFTPSAFRLNV